MMKINNTQKLLLAASSIASQLNHQHDQARYVHALTRRGVSQSDAARLVNRCRKELTA